MDPQEIITQIHDKLERSIGKVCKMENDTVESIKRAHAISLRISTAPENI